MTNTLGTMNLAVYDCPRIACTYLGPDVPPPRCPVHDTPAIVGVGWGGRHYEAGLNPAPFVPLGWEHPLA